MTTIFENIHFPLFHAACAGRSGIIKAGTDARNAGTAMDEKMLITALKKICRILAVALFMTSGFSVYDTAANTTAVAEASLYGATYDREIREGKRRINKYKEEYGAEQLTKDDPVFKIQENIVKCNPDKLSFTDHRKRHWVEPAYMTTYGWPDWGGESVGGPYIILDSLTISNLGERKLEHSEEVLYSSTVASLIAHECGHIINHDVRLRRLIEMPFSRPSVSTEARADDTGMDLLNNVPEYSIGSFLWVRDATPDRKHPTAQASVNQVIKKIKDLSGGRVILDKNGRLTFDGKIFMKTGYMSAKNDELSQKRTEYLAGQIASCINKGIWKKSHLATMPERFYFPEGRDGWTILAAFASSDCTGKPVKLLGSFHTTLDKKPGNRDSSREKEALFAVFDLAD